MPGPAEAPSRIVRYDLSWDLLDSNLSAREGAENIRVGPNPSVVTVFHIHDKTGLEARDFGVWLRVRAATPDGDCLRRCGPCELIWKVQRQLAP